ncbi:MAG: hypothetical protein E6924_06590, partial [Cutibacterium avidum]|nr:hypothetical protein [Cutibacterium avidum]
MADDGFDKGNHPDDSHSDDNETELISEQSDSGSAEGQSHEPTQELPENNDATQQISAEPDGSQTQGGNAPEWNPQTGQYDGWNAQYPQQGWEQQPGQQAWVGDPSQQGWDPNQYPQQGWDPNQYPQQGWEQQPSQESWEGQPAQQATEYLPDGSAGLAGATAADRPDVNESIGGIPFSDEPQPKRKSQYWIIAVAAVLVVALGVGLFYFLKPKNDDATKAVPAPASKPA